MPMEIAKQEVLDVIASAIHKDCEKYGHGHHVNEHLSMAHDILDSLIKYDSYLAAFLFFDK